MPPLNAKVVDIAPDEPALTPYDELHAVTDARLLDAEADNADWREVARIVLQIDPTLDPDLWSSTALDLRLGDRVSNQRRCARPVRIAQNARHR